MLSTIILSLLGNNTQKYIIYILITVASFIYINSYQLYYLTNAATLYNDTFHYDSLNNSVLIVAGLVALWLLATYSEVLNSKVINNEWLALIVLLVVSLAGLVTSNSNLSLFVAVELQSLALYILLSSPINSNYQQFFTNTSKIGLSYLMNAAAATGFLVFGIATNSTFLVMVSLIWKLGVVPVHVWSLPILDNLHSIMTAAYLTLAKYGLLVIIGILATVTTAMPTYLMWIGIVNLLVANVVGLLHYRYQRIITYSSLIQIGYMLLTLAFSSSLALTYFELYSIYTLMLLLLWANSESVLLQGQSVVPKVQL